MDEDFAVRRQRYRSCDFQRDRVVAVGRRAAGLLDTRAASDEGRPAGCASPRVATVAACIRRTPSHAQIARDVDLLAPVKDSG